MVTSILVKLVPLTALLTLASAASIKRGEAAACDICPSETLATNGLSLPTLNGVKLPLTTCSTEGGTLTCYYSLDMPVPLPGGIKTLQTFCPYDIATGQLINNPDALCNGVLSAIPA